jgi:hypothetical protein
VFVACSLDLMLRVQRVVFLPLPSADREGLSQKTFRLDRSNPPAAQCDVRGQRLSLRHRKFYRNASGAVKRVLRPEAIFFLRALRVRGVA